MMKKYFLKDVAFIKTGNSNANQANEYGKYRFFDRSQKTKYFNNYQFEGEYIIVAGEGNFEPKYFSGKFALHQRTYCITSKNNDMLRNKFLFYFIKTKKNYLIENSVGSTVPSLRLPVFERIAIPVINITKQQEIIDIISSLEINLEKISNLIKIINNVRNKLINKNFTTIDGKKMPLSSVLKVFNGNSKLTKKFISENQGIYPVYSSATKKYGLMGYIDTYMFNGQYITYTKDANVGVIFWRNGKFSLSNSFVVKTVNEKLYLTKFIYYYLFSIQDEIKANISSGATIKHFYPKDLLMQIIKIPDFWIQQEIIGIIDPIITKLNSLEEKLNNLIREYKVIHQQVIDSLINMMMNRVETEEE